MKNVNLTGLYLDLIVECDIRGFKLGGLRKIGSVEPHDMDLVFGVKDVDTVNLDKIKEIAENNITGEYKTMHVSKSSDTISIYVEFMNSDWDDSYAYQQ